MPTEPVKHAIVRNIVGRCHVSTSNLDIVREVVDRLKGKRRGFLKMPRNDRRYIVAAALQHHAENQVEYAAVMAGMSLSFRPRYYLNTKTRKISIKP